jgi:O-antigen/teichoic acid export membrane protein
MDRLTARVRRALPVLGTFALGQGFSQIMAAITGLLIVRWLSIDQYGEYGLVYSLQTTANIFTDLGFGATIVALVGQRANDPTVVGNYIRAGMSMRVRMLAIVFPLFAIYFVLMTSKLQWSQGTQISYLLAMLVSVQSSGVTSYYGAALAINKRLRQYYRVQALSSVLRLGIAWCLHENGLLSGQAAVWGNTLTLVLLAISMRKYGSAVIEEPPRPDWKVEVEMFRYIAPSLPSTLFFAVQGQITTLLVATFGHGTEIAQVAALSRLSQMFLFLTAFNPLVLEPWFAKSNREQMTRRFVLVVSIAGITAGSLALAAAYKPRIFLVILGSQYANLQDEVFWAVAASCVTYLTNVVWTLCSARRFVFWRITSLNVVTLTTTQVVFVAVLGVATPIHALQLGLCTAVASLGVEVFKFRFGLSQGARGGGAQLRAA